MNFCGKNIVFVGGFGDIGLEIGKQLVRKGIVNLIVLDKTLDANALKQLNSIDPQCYCQFMEFDVTQSFDKIREVVSQVAQKIRNIDVLINGAGFHVGDNIEHFVQSNLTGVVNTTIAAFEFMARSGGSNGRVIVNAGGVAPMTSIHQQPVHSAVISYTRELAKLTPETGITLYNICPQTTDIECAHNFLEAMTQHKNGAVWKCDADKLEEVVMQNV